MRSDDEDICKYYIIFIIKLINFSDLAYLAMGGDEDKKKGIDRQKLISLIKDEFNLTIDIQVIYKLTKLI